MTYDEPLRVTDTESLGAARFARSAEAEPRFEDLKSIGEMAVAVRALWKLEGKEKSTDAEWSKRVEAAWKRFTSP